MTAAVSAVVLYPVWGLLFWAYRAVTEVIACYKDIGKECSGVGGCGGCPKECVVCLVCMFVGPPVVIYAFSGFFFGFFYLLFCAIMFYQCK